MLWVLNSRSCSMMNPINGVSWRRGRHRVPGEEEEWRSTGHWRCACHREYHGRKLQPQQAWPPGHRVLNALTPAGSVRRAQKLQRVKTKEGAEGPLLPGPHHNGQREGREETPSQRPAGEEGGNWSYDAPGNRVRIGAGEAGGAEARCPTLGHNLGLGPSSGGSSPALTFPRGSPDALLC